MNLTEVGAQESVQHAPNIEGRLIAALRVPLRREWRRRCRALRRQRPQRRLDLRIALGDLVLMEVVQLERLLQREDMLGSIVARQRGSQRRVGGGTAHVTVSRQHLRRALALRQLLGGPAPWRRAAATRALGGVRRRLATELPAEADALRAEVRSTAEAIAALRETVLA